MAALIRGGSLLAALIALFERSWEDGVPLVFESSGCPSPSAGIARREPLSARDRRLLSLLVAGVADKSIASQMELSRHTVQRDVQRMIGLADATSVLSWPGRPRPATGCSTDTWGHWTLPFEIPDLLAPLGRRLRFAPRCPTYWHLSC
ncbi:LuxR C-terminal-related transcriptional regulator [Streptomyces sp. NPDC052015]|uniref:helix-turn-helix transcriptional regulator n=1 Tax=Streptomyces sp. NPDC052015 TaxID=3154755 RepID=UPI00343E594B